MALPTSTTLSAACGANDTTVLLASITDIAAGVWLKIDQEMMLVLAVGSAATVPVSVRRGQEGSAQVAHSATVQVIAGAAPTNLVTGDWAQAAAGAAQPISAPSTRTRRIKNYAANGAITLPNPGEDMVAILDGTNALTMTIASPPKTNDGDFLYVFANGKAAHLVTVNTGTAGIGNGGSGMDVGTFATTEATGMALVATNGFWVLWANGIASSGTQVAGVVFA